MPKKITAQVGRKRQIPDHEQEELEPALKQPRLEPAERQVGEPGRPYRDFVENEASAYWREKGKKKDPAGPAEQDNTGVAVPGPSRGHHSRNEIIKLKAVGAMAQHAAAKGWIKPPYSNPYQSPSFIDALIQLADDANWLARKIPLPAHPDPQHPTIYYVVDPVTNRPIPREDSYIRGDYVYSDDGIKVTSHERIYPLVLPEDGSKVDLSLMNKLKRDVGFTLEQGPEQVEVRIYWTQWVIYGMETYNSLLRDLQFSPEPPTPTILYTEIVEV